ncbi:MAG TPA: HAMP domain-containing sensor histidine kinase [Minicystis sp.]|nr:HAMP domain-containing sensor histidine kinase [Minicystis sp.]
MTEVASRLGAPVSVDEFATLNRCLDDAIAHAVTEYAAQRDRSRNARDAERVGVLTHELRNLVNKASLAFEVLSRGGVGTAGSTGSVLARSLQGLRRLIDSTLCEVRLDAHANRVERISLAEFIEDLEIGAMLEAATRKLSLVVAPIRCDAAIDADRQLLSSAMTNLVQNAIKFTRTNGHVRIDATISDSRVAIDVSDECGGLPAGAAEELFRPFEQRGRDRSGLGLGLAIARRAVEACGGVVRVRDAPGVGCVFTVDLPRAA